MIKLLDDSIGRILETLKNNNLENNTLVVFTSDHGGWYNGGAQYSWQGDAI